MKKNIYRTAFISDLDSSYIDKEIVVSGWIQNIRDHGGILFLDLRDSSGAIRNSNLDLLMKGFEIVGYSKEEVESRFQSLFTAFKYGCPPHGGMAIGIDRVLMLIKDEINLREVQAFPTSTSGIDLMMGSPSKLTSKQIEELGIIVKEERNE